MTRLQRKDPVFRERIFGKQFAAQSVRKDSKKLFVFFAGAPYFAHNAGVLERAALTDSNLLMVRDPFTAGYQKGLSADYVGLEGIAAFVRAQLTEVFPHTRELFIVGNSAGGAAAVYCGQAIKAKGVWLLAGRIVNPASLAKRNQWWDQLYDAAVRKGLAGQALIDEVEGAVRRSPVKRQRLMEDPVHCTDHLLLKRLVRMVRTSKFKNPMHFYYEETNEGDAFVANAFRSCPNVTLHSVRARPADLVREDGRPLDTHNVSAILNKQGMLEGLFDDPPRAPRKRSASR